jgi:glutamate 5-kinase
LRDFSPEVAEEMMETPQKLLAGARKIVIKLGSNTISDRNGKVDKNIMKHIVAQIMELINAGKRVVVVSSGAGVSGVGAINKWARKNDINYKQALCAIGQVELMNAYKEFFGTYGLHVGQILLTGDDFNEPHRELNIRNALFTLVDEGVVPIINENDSVSIDEFSIGDNDTLSALVANLWAADLLILMSDIDGVYDKDPHTHADAKLIEWVNDIDKLRKSIDTKGKSDFGTGGIVTKINAAEIVNRYGTAMMLVNSRKEDILGKLARGEEKATVFSGKTSGRD